MEQVSIPQVQVHLGLYTPDIKRPAPMERLNMPPLGVLLVFTKDIKYPLWNN